MNDLTVTQLLDSIGDRTPTPGGGAVASIVTAIAAALAKMVVNYSVNKKSLADHAADNQAALDRLETNVAEALRLAEADAVAFARLGSLWKLASDHPDRVAGWDDAVQAAIEAPQGVMRLCAAMLDNLSRLVTTTNTMLASDLAIAAILAEAGLRSASWNVRINLPQVGDPARRETLERETDQMVREATSVARDIEGRIAAG